MASAWELPVVGGTITMSAGADLSAAAAQFTFVKVSADNTIVQCAAATDKPIGVLQNTPKNGEEASVMVYGVSKVVASAALTAGNSVGTTASGQAVALTDGTDTTKYVMGQVLAGVGGASALVTVALQSPHRAS